MKKIILIVLSILIVYYGMFNDSKPILLFCLFLSFSVLLYFLLIIDSKIVINLSLIKNINIKNAFLQIPVEGIALIALLWIKLNTSNELLEIIFLILKGVVAIEFLTLFLIEIILSSKVDKE